MRGSDCFSGGYYWRLDTSGHCIVCGSCAGFVGENSRLHNTLTNSVRTSGLSTRPPSAATAFLAAAALLALYDPVGLVRWLRGACFSPSAKRRVIAKAPRA